jgi:hypothetical protein
MKKEHRPANPIVDRRTFCAAAGATALAALAPHPAAAKPAIDEAQPDLITGNGEFTYKVSIGWDDCRREPSLAVRMVASQLTRPGMCM